MNRKVLIAVLAAAAVAAAGSTWWFWRTSRHDSAMPPMTSGTSGADSAPSPGLSRGAITLDARRQQLIGVRTVKARRATLGQTIRTVGSVRYDETRVVDVNVKLDGWIRDLAADYTGRHVELGTPLLSLYSPDLLVAEQEYLLALAARDRMSGSVLPDAAARTDALVRGARERLARLDVSEDDLTELERSRHAADTLVIRSPASGIIIEKPALTGAHVSPGQTLYKLADVSVVWVEADVYEQDLASVHVGDRASVTLDAYPGAPERGRVVYIYPYVDENTRTNKVRYEFPNPRGRLKPGMFATVEITSGGGMGITVPADAVLDSGRDQIVFRTDGDGRFTPQPVTVGRRVGSDVQIVKGLAEGDEVATAAAFFLDSESQLRAGLQSYAPVSEQAGANPAATGHAMRVAVRTTPDPPRTGDNQFEVAVAEADGAPVTGASVSLVLFMPAMPTMNMPAMRNEIRLTEAAGGVYRGTGQVPMAGRWELTATVMRGGATLGTHQQPLVAK
jgi:Cu(I)/Ag(I) efflux system membrane fusion protein